MITVHHLNNSRSQRILWLLEELALEYRVQRYERDKSTMRAPASLKKVHPLGKSPIISDGDVVVAESGAIIEYLTNGPGEGRMMPKPGTSAHRDYVYWLHFAEGSLMTPALLHLVFGRLSKPPVPLIIRPLTRAIESNVKKQFIHPEARLLLDHVNSALSDQTWFTGDDLSAADVQMCFPLEAYEGAGLLKKSDDQIERFLSACRARPAYQAALERGGPYDLSFGDS